MKSGLRGFVAVSTTGLVAVMLGLGLSATGVASDRRAAVGSTQAGFERFLTHPPGNSQGISVEVSGIEVGPILSAACRGEGLAEGYGQAATYYRFICAARARNAKRLMILRGLLPSAGPGPIKYQCLGWR